jgi:hypothetical protein
MPPKKRTFLELLPRKVVKHINKEPYRYVEIALMKDNKDYVVSFLICLLYMLYNIDENDEDNRMSYAEIYLVFTQIAFKILYGYKYATSTQLDILRQTLLIKLIDKETTICNDTEKELHVVVSAYTDGTEAKAAVYNHKDWFKKAIKKCSKIPGSHVKIITMGINFVMDGQRNGAHANILQVIGKDVYRVEPNIDINNFYFSQSNTNYYTLFDKLEKINPAAILNLYRLPRELVQIDGLARGNYQIPGTTLYYRDYVNEALFRYFEGTGYTFQGYPTHVDNKCSSHGGMCNPVSSLLSVLEDGLTMEYLKYYTIKFCKHLIEQIDGQPVLIEPFADRINYINEFFKLSKDRLNDIYGYVNSDTFTVYVDGNVFTSTTQLKPGSVITINWIKKEELTRQNYEKFKEYIDLIYRKNIIAYVFIELRNIFQTILKGVPVKLKELPEDEKLLAQNF